MQERTTDPNKVLQEIQVESIQPGGWDSFNL
jgi:hypothetical protein